MLALIRVFWDIVLLRRGPRDLPASLSLLAGLALLDLGTSLYFLHDTNGTARSLVLGLLDLALVFAVFSTLLAVRDRRHRFVQTLSALLGAGVVLAVVQLVLVRFAAGLLDKETATAVVGALAIGFLLWGVLVVGHILRSALDVSLAMGLTLALTFMLAETLIFRVLAPPVAA